MEAPGARLITGEAPPTGDPNVGSAADGVEIAAPTSADAAEVAALHHRSWIATYGPLIRREDVARLTLAERVAFWRGLIEAGPPNVGALVAARSGQIVGLIQWETGIGDDQATGEIHAVHVAAEERGQGVGRRLLEAALVALRENGAHRAVLWVVEGNGDARAFYQRLGWHFDGTRLERPLGGFGGFPTVIEVRYAREL